MKRTSFFIALVIGLVGFSGVARAETVNVDFESGYSVGSVNGQNGWTATGSAGSGCALYDEGIVANSTAPISFGTQSFRISNAITSGCFGDQAFVAPLDNAVGETTATAGTFSVGTRQTHFEAQFDIAAASPVADPGLKISVSPDRGDGSRMSYLRFEDDIAGIKVFFDDVQGTSPANFIETQIGTLDRTASHSVKFVFDAVEGASNDTVGIYLDGSLAHSGTSWENYYRFDPEAAAEQSPRVVKTLIIRAGGAAAPSTAGAGFLFDNITLSNPLLPPASVVYVDSAFVDGASCTNAGHVFGNDCFATIQAGVNAVTSGGTVNVVAGAYPESVTINKALDLIGAGSSTINGQVTVAADDVLVSNFTITNPSGNFGVLINGANDVEVTNNVITGIGTLVSAENSYGIYYQDGALDSAGVTITGNTISNIGNTTVVKSNGGIGIGDSTGSSQISDVEISDNAISLIISLRGAYGILLNHAVAVSGGAVIAPEIDNNTISNLNGLWATAIGLEGRTPNAMVTHNTISSLTSTVGAVGVHVEDNSDAGSVKLYYNLFSDTNFYGVVNSVNSTGVDALFNWWGDASGPASLDNPGGIGAGISPGVSFSPWFTDTAMTELKIQTLSDDENVYAEFAVPFTASTTANSGEVTVEIPVGAIVTGSASWDGTLTLPTSTLSFTLVTDPGTASRNVEAIEIGAGDTPLQINYPVKITFVGQAGKLAGWSRGGIFTQISECADYEGPTPSLVPGGDCKENESDDLVIWTTHFSQFIVYDQTPVAYIKIIKQSTNGVGSFNFTVTDHDDFLFTPTLTTTVEKNNIASISFEVPVSEGETYYDITEDAIAGWDFGGVSCEYSNESEGESILRGENVGVYQGEEVVCTFTNISLAPPTPSPTPTPEQNGAVGLAFLGNPAPSATPTPTPAPTPSATPVQTPRPRVSPRPPVRTPAPQGSPNPSSQDETASGLNALGTGSTDVDGSGSGSSTSAEASALTAAVGKNFKMDLCSDVGRNMLYTLMALGYAVGGAAMLLRGATIGRVMTMVIPLGLAAVFAGWARSCGLPVWWVPVGGSTVLLGLGFLK